MVKPAHQGKMEREAAGVHQNNTPGPYQNADRYLFVNQIRDVCFLDLPHYQTFGVIGYQPVASLFADNDRMTLST